ncbi:ABC transporter permease [Chelativorans sp. SCAU2101]|uniref:ABC transporter permease n=1 Tax=Chelativorans petroleitrophicus TaxID=2975484 RepID=A0A9X3AZL0_9HYPH|nr:ABC transporter permease [Chelativorans petroleitrophicus]MCT8990350.1 ABC transporter permease [Chelativorans petroleitrophicus]
MIRMIGKRLSEVIPTLLILSVIIFVLQRLLPGDPALALAGEDADRELIEQIRQQYGLNQPLPVQYFKWSGGILYGDLGQSMRMNRPVLDLILARLPVTLQLAVFSMIIALAVGITAGIIAAVRKQSAWDYGANLVALAGISVPNFWLGIMMILVFSVMLNWLPASGYVSPLIDPLRSLQSLLMPSIVLGTAIAGVIMRHTRSAMLQALESDYVRTARAKGLAEWVVVVRHAMRNALTPVITLGALEFGNLLGGAVLTEQIFNIPGFGKLIVDAVYNRDYAVVQGVVLVTALIYVLMSLLADIGYMLANPRLRN